jgi:hypothetical protein
LLYDGQYLTAVGEGILLAEDVSSNRRVVGLEELLGADKQLSDGGASRAWGPGRPSPGWVMRTYL